MAAIPDNGEAHSAATMLQTIYSLAWGEHTLYGKAIQKQILQEQVPNLKSATLCLKWYFWLEIMVWAQQASCATINAPKKRKFYHEEEKRQNSGVF